ncbi:MAG: hypothetical protein ABJB11_13635 [Ferruginibacter sp.]
MLAANWEIKLVDVTVVIREYWKILLGGDREFRKKRLCATNAGGDLD